MRAQQTAKPLRPGIMPFHQILLAKTNHKANPDSRTGEEVSPLVGRC